MLKMVSGIETIATFVILEAQDSHVMSDFTMHFDAGQM